MQLVPELATELQHMRLARSMKSGRLIRPLPGPGEALSLVVPLLAFAIRRAGRIAIAMEARGLSPGAQRTYVNVPKFRARDAVFAVLALGILWVSAVHRTRIGFMPEHSRRVTHMATYLLDVAVDPLGARSRTLSLPSRRYEGPDRKRQPEISAMLGTAPLDSGQTSAAGVEAQEPAHKAD